MSTAALLACFEAWRARGDALVLATVVATEGSTYTKAGHRILIDRAGDYQGLVSGGCLEGDLASHAQRVLATGRPQLISYDLRTTPDDEVFGLAVGCQGLLRIFLQPLLPGEDYAPMNRLAGVLRGDEPGVCELVIDGPDAGTTRIHTGPDLAGLPGMPAPTTTTTVRLALRPLPRLLVLGAGPDAVPVLRLADLLGYRVDLLDHRPGHLEKPGFETAEFRCAAPVSELPARVALARYAAALVMSHHLPSDRAYLQALAASPVPYIGLLGPAHRRERLLRELGATGASLAGRLHGPAGLDIGADSPESIALSIFAELQAVRARP